MTVQLDHYIGVYDNVVDEEFCQRIIKKFDDIIANSWFSEQAVSDGTNQFSNSSLGRKDKSLFFERVAREHAQEIQNVVGQCMMKYMEQYVGLNDANIGSFACKVQKTEPRGGYHVWHSEHAGDLGSMRRAAVWILYLTTHETDGETEFLQQGIRVAPQAGRVVIWPASYTHPHRGNPVYDGDKYIATGWFEHYWDMSHA